MLRLSGVILCMLFAFTHGNAQIKIKNSRKVQKMHKKDFEKRLQSKSYREVKSSSSIKNVLDNAQKQYPGTKVEKVFKNKEGVYGIVLFHSRERAIPSGTRKAYGRIMKKNNKLKMDRNRQLVFYDGTNWGDESNLPSDIFFPSDTFFPSDIFFPGHHFFPGDHFSPRNNLRSKSRMR